MSYTDVLKHFANNSSFFEVSLRFVKARVSEQR